MQGFTVLEAIDKALFSRQAGDEGKVGLARLHAELAHVVIPDRAKLVLNDALTFEHQLKNLRDGLLLKDAPVRAQSGAGQDGFDQCVVVGTVEAAFALAESADQAVHVTHRTFAIPDREHDGFIQQLAEIDVGFEADQFQFEGEGRADRFLEFERHHFKFGIANEWLEGVPQIRLAGHEKSFRRLRVQKPLAGHACQECSAGLDDRFTPVVGAFGACGDVGPGDLAV